MSISKEIKMVRDLESVQHEALLNIVRTASCIDKLSQPFFQQFNMTQSQYNILIVLKLEGRDLTQIELGDRLVSSRSTITSLIDKLEKKQFVQRKRVSGDRRVYEVHLTDTGRKALDVAEKAYVKKVEEVMKGLSEKDSKLVSQILEKLRNSL